MRWRLFLLLSWPNAIKDLLTLIPWSLVRHWFPMHLPRLGLTSATGESLSPQLGRKATTAAQHLSLATDEHGSFIVDLWLQLTVLQARRISTSCMPWDYWAMHRRAPIVTIITMSAFYYFNLNNLLIFLQGSQSISLDDIIAHIRYLWIYFFALHT